MKTNIVPKMKKIGKQRNTYPQSVGSHESIDNFHVSTQSESDADDPDRPTIDTQKTDLKSRLERLNRRRRFSEPVNWRCVATLWAREYVDQVFPSVQGSEKMRLMLSAESGFIASSELASLGIEQWKKSINNGRNAKEDFPDL
jgi:hypothetical protein